MRGRCVKWVNSITNLALEEGLVEVLVFGRGFDPYGMGGDEVRGGVGCGAGPLNKTTPPPEQGEGGTLGGGPGAYLPGGGGRWGGVW